MKVFVTGASGQLGYDVCRELANRGIEYKGVSVIIPRRECMQTLQRKLRNKKK